MRPKTFLCIINLNPNSHGGGRVCARAWALHDIGITNIVRCISKQTRVRRGSRILPNNRAIILQ